MKLCWLGAGAWGPRVLGTGAAQEQHTLRLCGQPATTKSWPESSAFGGGKMSTAMLLMPIYSPAVGEYL